MTTPDGGRTFSVSRHPGPSSPAASSRMAVRRRRDTTPELLIRRALHVSGVRYRVAFPVPGRRRRSIDIAFTRKRVAVFVDGCFWHGCPIHGVQPTANAAWWIEKMDVNQKRDADTSQYLESLGWRVLRFWEHEPVTDVVEAILREVRSSDA